MDNENIPWLWSKVLDDGGISVTLNFDGSINLDCPNDYYSCRMSRTAVKYLLLEASPSRVFGDDDFSVTLHGDGSISLDCREDYWSSVMPRADVAELRAAYWAIHE